MLTINEKQNLALHQREVFWTKYLITAFFSALAIHLAGYLLFKVKPISISNSMKTLPPISVFMEPSIQKAHDVAASLPSGPVPRYPLPPHPKEKPALSLLDFSLPAVLLKEDDNLFLKKRKRTPFFPPRKDSQPDTFRLILVGNLQNRKFIDPFPTENISGMNHAEIYNLTVDDSTGDILWITPNDDLSLLISRLKLEPLPNGTLTQGTLEVRQQ